MSRRKSSGWVTALVLILAGCLWLAEQWPSSPEAIREERDVSLTTQRGKIDSPESRGSYEVYRGCTLVPDKGNDGDSFKVKLPDGRIEILRLYFVDTPESAFRSYRGGETNHARIRDQAKALGGISPDEAVAVGHDAKTWVLATLAKRPFTISTRWDSPFNDRRYHAFVEIEEGGRPRLVHEILVERGWCRIHTKGADLPDGTARVTHQDALRTMEAKARNARIGAWGLR